MGRKKIYITALQKKVQQQKNYRKWYLKKKFNVILNNEGSIIKYVRFNVLFDFNNCIDYIL
jgi:hypothetical protein